MSETLIMAAFIVPALIGLALSFRCQSPVARRILRWNAFIFVPISLGFVFLDAACTGSVIFGYKDCLGGVWVKSIASSIGVVFFLIHLLYIFIDAPLFGIAGHFEIKHRWPRRRAAAYAPPILGFVILCILVFVVRNG